MTYTEKLIEWFGMNPIDAKRFTEEYLMFMEHMGYNKPGFNGRPETNEEMTLFGGIFYQINMGGHQMLTPEGKPVRALMVMSDQIQKNEAGDDCWRIYMIAPGFGLGDMVVILRGCDDPTDVTVLHGISDKERGVVGVIDKLCGWEEA